MISSLFIKSALGLTALLLLGACSKQEATPPVVQVPKPLAPVNPVAPSSTVGVDAPRPVANTAPLDTSALLAQRGPVLSLDSQNPGATLQPVALINSGNVQEGKLQLDAPGQPQVVQTPALRFEARAQAMKEMHGDRGQQK